MALVCYMIHTILSTAPFLSPPLIFLPFGRILQQLPVKSSPTNLFRYFIEFELPRKGLSPVLPSTLPITFVTSCNINFTTVLSDLLCPHTRGLT